MKKFRKYVKGFDFNNDKIKYKYYHSLRVKRLSKYLAKKIGFNKEEIKLASFIGLYHDIARFEQVTEFNTFKDSESFDHGDRGYDLLKKLDFLDDFDKKDKNIILKAVKNHNKFKMENFMNDREIMHSKLIRDADKIDILKKMINSKIINYNKLSNNTSKFISKEFFENELIENKEIKNEDDRLLRDLSFVYDINFKESIRYLYKKNYINKIYKRVKNKEYYKKYFDELNKYIEMGSKLC